MRPTQSAYAPWHVSSTQWFGGQQQYQPMAAPSANHSQSQIEFGLHPSRRVCCRAIRGVYRGEVEGLRALILNSAMDMLMVPTKMTAQATNTLKLLGRLMATIPQAGSANRSPTRIAWGVARVGRVW